MSDDMSSMSCFTSLGAGVCEALNHKGRGHHSYRNIRSIPSLTITVDSNKFQENTNSSRRGELLTWDSTTMLSRIPKKDVKSAESPETTP